MKSIKFISMLMIVALCVLSFSACGDDDTAQPYDPAGAIAGTYVGEALVYDSKNDVIFDGVYSDAALVVKKVDNASVRFDLYSELGGKKMLSDIPMSCGPSQDGAAYNMAGISPNYGTITKNGHMELYHTCTIKGVSGYHFTFNGQKSK